MSWTFTADPEVYAKAVLPLLTADPAANTVALTVLDAIRNGQRWGDGPFTLGWYTEAGQVTGAVSMTPPYGLLLTQVPEAAQADLVNELRSRGTTVPDINGTEPVARRFVELWGAPTELIMAQRLFRLGTLIPPDPTPAGSARLATIDDLDLVMEWMAGFRAESEPQAADTPQNMMAYRVERDLYWFWLDRQGNPVSMAGRNVTVAGMSRVGPVYTPPEQRRHGYAAGATAACSQHARDTGAEQVVLFTDLANPTSNGVYQRLGYEPVSDRLILRFV